MVDTARRLLGVPLWAHEGLSRAEATPVVDPDLIRGLDVGQAAYIYRGGVTYVQVKRLVAGPAELPGPAPGRRARHTAAVPGRGVAAPGGARPARWPARSRRRRARRPGGGSGGRRAGRTSSALLDDAFGQEP